eukprot:7473364-Pyramimonas_sp.AAC.1
MTVSRLWSRCSSCSRAEWNDILSRQQCFCSCGKKVKLFVPSSAKKELAAAHRQPPWRAGAEDAPPQPPSSVAGHMAAALAASDDPELKKILQAKIEELKAAPAARAAPPPSEAVMVSKAEGVWKDCNHKHDQAVANVRRLRAALQVAEEEEQLAARSLASAEIGKRQAAQALARAAGLQPAPEESGPKPAFEVTWDDELFN